VNDAISTPHTVHFGATLFRIRANSFCRSRYSSDNPDSAAILRFASARHSIEHVFAVFLSAANCWLQIWQVATRTTAGFRFSSALRFRWHSSEQYFAFNRLLLNGTEHTSQLQS